MLLHMDRWLLAALLLSAICCSAADDSEDVEAATFWWNKVNTTICTTYSCPAGQYATSADTCQPCLPGTYKAAEGNTCCETCKAPQQTFNTTNNTFAYRGATGCGCPKGTYKATWTSLNLTLSVCRPCAWGSVADWGATNCTACGPPQTPNTLKDKCVDPCPAGTMNWKGTCLNCTLFYKPAANPTPGGVCTPCKEGTTTTTGVTCDKCLTGYYNSGNATDAVCNTCAENYYNPRYWSWRQQQKKRSASPNRFSHYNWPVICKPCPLNTFTLQDNKQAKCCPAGKAYDADTNRCV